MGNITSTLATTCDCCISRGEYDDVVPIDSDVASPEIDPADGIGTSLRVFPGSTGSRASRHKVQEGGLAPLQRRKVNNRRDLRSEAFHRSVAPTSEADSSWRIKGCSAEPSNEVQSSGSSFTTRVEFPDVVPARTNGAGAREVTECTIPDQEETADILEDLKIDLAADGGSFTEAQTDDDLYNDVSEALELFRSVNVVGRSSLSASADQDEDVMEMLKILEVLDKDEVLSQGDVSTELDNERDTSLSCFSNAESDCGKSPISSSRSQQRPGPWTWEAHEVRNRLRSTSSLVFDKSNRRKSAEKPNEIAMVRAKLRSAQSPRIPEKPIGFMPPESSQGAKAERLLLMLRSRPGLLKHLNAKVASKE